MDLDKGHLLFSNSGGILCQMREETSTLNSFSFCFSFHSQSSPEQQRTTRGQWVSRYSKIFPYPTALVCPQLNLCSLSSAMNCKPRPEGASLSRRAEAWTPQAQQKAAPRCPGTLRPSCTDVISTCEFCNLVQQLQLNRSGGYCSFYTSV